MKHNDYFIGNCDCPKIKYIWYDGFKPSYVCQDCNQPITWRVFSDER